MREFLKGRKRQFGMLTLLLACLGMMGWIRSRGFSDVLMFQIDTPQESRSNSLISCEKGLVWIRQRRSKPDDDLLAFAVPPPQWFTCHTGLPSGYLFDRRLYDGSIWESYWRGYVWKWYGIRVDTFDEKSHRGEVIRIWVLPYWLVVMPLALISVYLILDKPKSSATPTPTSGIGPT